MRVAMLLLHDMLTPSPDIRVRKEAETLSRAGHSVTVFCWDREGGHRTEESSRGFRVVRTGPHVGAAPLALAKKVSVFREVSKNLMESAASLVPEVVHAHDFETLPAGAKLKSRLRVPLVYDSHEDWPALEAMHSKVLSKATQLAERRLLKKVDLVITIGERLGEKFRRAGHAPTILLNAPRAAEFPLPRRDPLLRLKLGFREEDFVIVISGSVFKDRGDDVLFRAMRELGTMGARLLVVGGRESDVGALRKAADTAGVASWCVFTGHVPAGDVPGLLSVSDAGVLPFKRTPLMEIALGNKAFEFLAAGLPVVASDLGEMRATLGPSGAVVFAAPGDPATLGAALRGLMMDPSRRRRLGADGRRAFEEKFAWEHQETKLVKLYEEISASRQGGGGR